MRPTPDEVRAAIKRFLKKRMLPSAAFGCLPAVLQLGHWLPEQVVPRALAFLLIATAVSQSLRLGLHVADGYCSWQDRRRRLLTCLVGADAVLTAVWLIGGIVLARKPDPVIECVGCGLLFFAVPTVAAWTVATARSIGKRRGSEFVRTLPFVKGLRDVQDRMAPLPTMRFFAGLWRHKTKPTEISAFIVFVTTVLMAVALANAPKSTVEAIAWLGQKHEDNDAREVRKPISTGARQGHALGEAAPPSPGAAPGSSAPEDVPSYEHQCGPFALGDDVPPAEAAVLHDLWLGGHGLAGAGAGEAGCAQQAQAEVGHPDIWWVLGICDSDLRSIGIAVPGRSGALLLQQPARFAYARLLDGTLVWATSRVRVGTGDLYLVDTESGTYVLVRSQSSSGAVDPSANSSSCGALTNENVSYAILPPALVGRWLALVRERGWNWPTKDNSLPDSDSSFVFVANAAGGTVIARGTCRSPTDCDLLVRGKAIDAPPGAHIILDDVLQYAPAPPPQDSGTHP